MPARRSGLERSCALRLSAVPGRFWQLSPTCVSAWSLRSSSPSCATGWWSPRLQLTRGAQSVTGALTATPCTLAPVLLEARGRCDTTPSAACCAPGLTVLACSLRRRKLRSSCRSGLRMQGSLAAGLPTSTYLPRHPDCP